MEQLFREKIAQEAIPLEPSAPIMPISVKITTCLDSRKTKLMNFLTALSFLSRYPCGLEAWRIASMRIWRFSANRRSI